jgi:resuscitation-promoting factor RpfB
MPRVLAKAHLFFLLALGLLAACQVTTTKRVVILVDGQRRVVETRAATVAQVLHEEKIQLGSDDRVDPPGYTPIDRTATIQITRVAIKTEKTREPIAFTRQVTRDEAMPEGKTRVVQLGANGEAEITFQVTLEDGVQVSRRELSRVVMQPPRDEILVLGTQNSLPPVQVRGTLVYLAHGNAWVMRNSSGDKRPLTFEGDLDGRVFDLSPDGRYLLYTRTDVGANDHSPLLNSLWLADTVILNQAPRRVPLDNLLYAQWAPDGSNQLAYSTGEKTPGAPGWKAHNDLYIATLSGLSGTMPVSSTVTVGITSTRAITTYRTTTLTVSANTPITLTRREVVAPSVPAVYGWWGSNLAWSPDAQVFAYGFANQIGFINAATGARRAVKSFAFYNTRAAWVWTPQVTWSPDSRFIAAAVHAPPEDAGPFEDSPAFDLWVSARDNSVNLALGRQVGMWAAPIWSPRDAEGESKIAYGVALNTADSERSRYALYVMDRDGSHRQKIFPTGAPRNDDGLQIVQVAWSPDVSQLVAVRDGDLWLYDFARSAWSQLTANGDTRLLRWK